MFEYLQDLIATLPEDLQTNRVFNTPAGDHLFTVNEDADRLSSDKAETFHHYVAKLLFAAKRTRPDIATAIAFLCTRVKSPDVDDWKKLCRVLKYIQLTPFLPLTLGWDETGTAHWYVDASFAVHNDMRSHTGGMMSFGQGAIIGISTKQKINTKSSTEAEIVGVDDVLNVQVWCRYYLDAQYEMAEKEPMIKYDKLYQDNVSSIRLEKNGKASSTKRTRHINIRYFAITDRLNANDSVLSVDYCPTGEMVADLFTKPLQGSLYRKHRNSVLGITTEDYDLYKREYYSAKATRKNDDKLN